MISKIQNERRLKDCIRYEIEEIQPDDGHKINVEVDKRLTHKDYVGIKVDDYYNGLHINKPPKSVDFVVRLQCILLSLRTLIVRQDLI